MNGSESAWKRAWRWLRWVLLAEACLLSLRPTVSDLGDLDFSHPLLAANNRSLHLYADPTRAESDSVPLSGPWCARGNALVLWSAAPETITVVGKDGPIERYRLPARSPAVDPKSAYRDPPGPLLGAPLRMTPHPDGIVLVDGAGCFLFRFDNRRLVRLPEAADAISKETESTIAVVGPSEAARAGRLRFVSAEGRTVVSTSISPRPFAWDWSRRWDRIVSDQTIWSIGRPGKPQTILDPPSRRGDIQIDEESGLLWYGASGPTQSDIAVYEPGKNAFRGWRQRGFYPKPPFVEARPALVQAFRRLKSLVEEKQFP